MEDNERYMNIHVQQGNITHAQIHVSVSHSDFPNRFLRRAMLLSLENQRGTKVMFIVINQFTTCMSVKRQQRLTLNEHGTETESFKFKRSKLVNRRFESLREILQ